MELTHRDRSLLSSAITTEVARYKRAINTNTNQAIKELIQTDMRDLELLEAHILNNSTLPKGK